MHGRSESFDAAFSAATRLKKISDRPILLSSYTRPVGARAKMAQFQKASFVSAASRGGKIERVQARLSVKEYKGTCLYVCL